MKLMIDGIAVNPKPDESLLHLVRRLKLDSPLLSKRPIAAKIAGEVFNLNYVPVRAQDVAEERISIRRAMAARGIYPKKRTTAGRPPARNGVKKP